MPKSNRLLDQLDRNARHKTRERRENRTRRRNLLLGFLLLFGLLFILGLPSLISQSGYSRTLLARAARGYGFDVKAKGVRIGWFTPVRLTGLEAQGTSGSRIELEQLDAEFTVLDALRGQTQDLGVIDVRGLHIECAMDQGRCSLEDDLAPWISPASSGNTPESEDQQEDPSLETASFRFQDVTVEVVQAESDQTWALAQGSGEVVYGPRGIEGSLVGVLREPTGEEGSIQGRLTTSSTADSGATERSVSDPRQTLWNADVQCESLPLSIVSLGESRWGDTLPADIRGDLSGQIAAYGFASGAIEVSLRGVEVRNFAATEPAAYSQRTTEKALTDVDPNRLAKRLWHNELATLQGDLVFQEDSISGRQLQFQSDFASGRFDGTIANSLTFLGSNDNLLRWLDRIDGVAETKVDLAQLHRALPGLLPTRAGAEIVEGQIHGRMESLNGQRVARSQLVVQTDRIQARSSGRDVFIEPVRLTAIVADNGGELMAEKFQLESDFAVATGQGDLGQGQADVEIDFSRLATSLRPIVDLSDVQLRGNVAGQIQWDVNRFNRWHLVGKGRGRNLMVSLPGGRTLERRLLDADAEAIGIWDGSSLQEMSAAELHLSSDGLNVHAELTDPVRSPDDAAIFPVRLIGSGPLGTLRDVVATWLPDSVQEASGSFQFNGQGDVTSSACRLTSAVMELRQPRLIAPLHTYQQQRISLQYGGDLRIPEGIAKVDKLLVKGDAFTVNANGYYSTENVDLNASWNADLTQLSDSRSPRIATRPGIQQVGFDARNPSATKGWSFSGKSEGQIHVTNLANAAATHGQEQPAGQPHELSDGRQYLIRATMQGRDLAILERNDVATTQRQPRGQQAIPATQTVWSEPSLQVVTDSIIDTNSGRLDSRSTEVVTHWFATDLSGHAVWNEEDHDVRLRGPTSMKMNEVARLLTQLTGTSIRAIGEHQAPVQIRVGMAKAGGVAFDISGHLGWEQAEIGGVTLGESNVPFHMTESKVILDRTKIPVGGGHVDPAGQVHYRPGPMQIHLKPGRLAERVRVTPEMADRWLKYLAPVMADVARIDGTIGCDIQEGFLVLDDPSQSRISGRLNIDEMEMSSGPMTSSIIGGVDQLRGLAGLADGRPYRDRSNTRLIRLPPQQVDFQLNQGQVIHRRLIMQIDRAEIFTGGSVTLDGGLNMVAQVPLDERWLGNDLKSLAGQSMRFPIQGTIWQPRLDNREMQRVVAGLGAQAVQGAVDGYLDKGRQKINEELLRGLDKLNLGPLFGQ